MSGNLTSQFHSDDNHPQEKLVRAQQNPTAFLLEEAINNFFKLNLSQAQQASLPEEPHMHLGRKLSSKT